MGKGALKAVGVLLSRGRLSKRLANRTLTIAIALTLVALGLLVVYLMQRTPVLP